MPRPSAVVSFTPNDDDQPLLRTPPPAARATSAGQRRQMSSLVSRRTPRLYAVIGAPRRGRAAPPARPTHPRCSGSPTPATKESPTKNTRLSALAPRAHCAIGQDSARRESGGASQPVVPPARPLGITPRCASSSAGSGRRGSAGHREPAVDGAQRRSGDEVAVEQRAGAQPAGEVQLGQRAGQRDPGGQPDARLQRGRHHARQPGRLGHPQRPAHPAQRRALEHRDVGGAGDGHPQRVVGPADRLVGGDPDVDPAADRRELVDRGAGLLHVLQPAGGAVQRADGRDRRVDVPGPVGVDAHRAGRPQRVADRLDPREVVAERTLVVGDLDLHRAAARPGRRRRAPARGRRPARSRSPGPSRAPGRATPPSPARRPRRARLRPRRRRTRGTGRTRPTPPGPRRPCPRAR